MRSKPKGFCSFLIGGLSLILFATLVCTLYGELTEINGPSPSLAFSNLDPECLVVYNKENFYGTVLASFPDSSWSTSNLNKYPSFFFIQLDSKKLLVLRC
jgi:hypothetical protein